MGKISTYANISAPVLTDYVLGDLASGPTTKTFTLDRLLGLVDAFGFRLTTETGVPVSTSDRTAQGTIYLTPSQNLLSGFIKLYDGTRWRMYQKTTDTSLPLTVTSGKNYDWFVYDNAGTITLELSAAWTNDTTRADALTLQDGIPVKSGAATRRHGGMIRASGTNVTADAFLQRFVANTYNTVWRPARAVATTNHVWNTNSERDWNNDTSTQIEFVLPAPVPVVVTLVGRQGQNQNGVVCNALTYIRMDGTTYTTEFVQAYLAATGTSITSVNFFGTGGVRHTYYLGAGYHVGIVREQGAGTQNEFSSASLSADLFN